MGTIMTTGLLSTLPRLGQSDMDMGKRARQPPKGEGQKTPMVGSQGLVPVWIDKKVEAM